MGLLPAPCATEEGIDESAQESLPQAQHVHAGLLRTVIHLPV